MTGIYMKRNALLKWVERKRERQTDRSSHPEVFCKKVALKKFTKFTGKHLCQSLFFSKEPLF